MSKTIGRPSKLNPKVKDRLFRAIRMGTTLETACAYAGVSRFTVSEWQRRGQGRHKRPSTPELRQFTAELELALADAELVLLARVNAASQSDWRAAAWMLERRYSDRWANTQRIKVEAERQTQELLNYLLSHSSERTKAEILGLLALPEYRPLEGLEPAFEEAFEAC
jgi:transposase